MHGVTLVPRGRSHAARNPVSVMGLWVPMVCVCVCADAQLEMGRKTYLLVIFDFR